MSAIAAIAISDGAVSHTFNPVSSTPDPFYRDSQAGLALVGQPTIKTRCQLDKGSGLNKVTVTITCPALELVTGQNSAGYTAAPKVGYEHKAIVTLILPSRGTSSQRVNLRSFLVNLMTNAQITDLVDNLLPQF